MIQSINGASNQFSAYAVQNKTNQSNIPIGAVEAEEIKLEDLFSPSEIQTLQNMRSFAETKSISNREIRLAELTMITAKMSDKSMPMKDAVRDQIRGVKEGFGNDIQNLSFLEDLYANWDSFRGLNLKA